MMALAFRALLGVLLLAAVNMVWVNAGAALAATAKPKTVYIMTFRGCEEVCTGFRDYLERQGEPVEFVIRDAGSSLARVADFVAEAKATRPDLVVTWGTGVTLAAVGPYDAVDPSRHITDIPVVYLFVGNPTEAKIARSTTASGRPNVAGANTTVSFEAQYNTMLSYRPVKRVGFVYNADEPAAVVQAQAALEQFRTRGVEVVEERLPAGADGKPTVEAFAPAMARVRGRQAEMLYYVGSSFILSNIEAFSRAALDQKLPVFTSFELPFRKGGALLGLVSPLRSVGQIAGYQAAQVLFAGKPAGELPTPSLTRFTVLINMQAARELTLWPPMRLLQFAEVAP